MFTFVAKYKKEVEASEIAALYTAFPFHNQEIISWVYYKTD